MLNERNKANKEAKNAAMKERGIKRQFAGRFKPVDGDHPQGRHGQDRGFRRQPARKVGSIVMKGKTGTVATDTKEPRLVTRDGKRRKVATELLKNKSTSAGPKGKLPDHTVYQDIGYLMAEALGLVSETKSSDPLHGSRPRREGGRPKGTDADLRAELAAKAEREGKTPDDVIIQEPARPRTPEEEAARKRFQAAQRARVKEAKRKHAARTKGKK